MSTNSRIAGRFLRGSAFLIIVSLVLPILLLEQLGKVLAGVGGPLA